MKSRPRMSFTWLVAMIMAAADVKPTETGPEMKSIKNPERKEFAREAWTRSPK